MGEIVKWNQIIEDNLRKRFSGIQFWDGVLFGCLVGFISAMALCWAVDALPEKFWQNSVYLFGTVATLFAAIIALSGPRSMIQSQNSVAAQQRQDNLAAALSTLPLVLTKFMDICEAGIKTADTNSDALREPILMMKTMSALEIDTGSILVLKDCIQFSRPHERKWLELVITHYQVYRSRTLGFIVDPTETFDDHEKASTASDWIILKAIIEHLFPFSRGEEQVPAKIDPTRIHVPHHLFALNHERLDLLRENLESYKRVFSPLDVDSLSLFSLRIKSDPAGYNGD